MTGQIRRIVAAVNADGLSEHVIDGTAPQVFAQPGRGLTFHELWTTDGVGADGGIEHDPGARPVSHHPIPGGTSVRIVVFEPDATRISADVDADMAAIGAESRTVANEDPTFHRNDTVDYNIILSGEIYAVTEQDEVRLGPGDVLIQRGTAHTWSNRSDEPCVYASVMVTAEPKD